MELGAADVDRVLRLVDSLQRRREVYRDQNVPRLVQPHLSLLIFAEADQFSVRRDHHDEVESARHFLNPFLEV